MEQVAYEKRAHYPHMKPADIAIWERFIERFPGAYQSVAYDVAVGSGPAFDTVVVPETGGDAIKLYQRKIDVVGFREGERDIIEVKPRAGSSAYGQVLGYLTLLKRDQPTSDRLRAVVITDSETPDQKMLADEMGVKLFIV